MKRKFFVLLLLLVLSGAFQSCAKRNSFRSYSEFEGIWEGRGQQDNGSSWTIKVTVSGNDYKIEYPSLRCGGTLTPISVNPGNIEFMEKIEFGRSCINNGVTVLIKKDENTLLFEWFYPNGGKKGATGILYRKY